MGKAAEKFFPEPAVFSFLFFAYGERYDLSPIRPADCLFSTVWRIGTAFIFLLSY
ncbi:hypothetical protein [uncultured Desulfosarcina sp.]|uniref:hypothetical protein n=1 Tax=uncultured Desulfosarcina sp. TaxID=218289 RepID=UPI0029C630C4|nr:hypothetical protein [uncultured Desulfosarcina sp.]